MKREQALTDILGSMAKTEAALANILQCAGDAICTRARTENLAEGERRRLGDAMNDLLNNVYKIETQLQARALLLFGKR